MRFSGGERGREGERERRREGERERGITASSVPSPVDMAIPDQLLLGGADDGEDTHHVY